MSISNNTNLLQDLLNAVNALPEAGVDLPELSNEGSASDLLYGKELIDQDGNKITGTIETFDGSYECSGESTGEDVTQEINAYTEKLVTLESAITALETELEGKSSGGDSGGGNLIKFQVYGIQESFIYEFIAYEGMTWENFCSSIFNLQECFSFGGIDADTGAVYMSWVEPKGSLYPDIFLIVGDSSGSFITDSIIQNEMIIHANKL